MNLDDRKETLPYARANARKDTCMRMYIRYQPSRVRPINQAPLLARQSFAIAVGSKGTLMIPLGYDLFRLRENESLAGHFSSPVRYDSRCLRDTVITRAEIPSPATENNVFQLLRFVQISTFTCLPVV